MLLEFLDRDMMVFVVWKAFPGEKQHIPVCLSQKESPQQTGVTKLYQCPIWWANEYFIKVTNRSLGAGMIEKMMHHW